MGLASDTMRRIFVVAGVVGAGVVAWDSQQSNSFMTDPATDALSAARPVQAARLQEIVRDAQAALNQARSEQALACGFFDTSCKKRRAEAAEAEAALLRDLRQSWANLMYDGANADDRDDYVRQYGCVAWTDTALRALATAASECGIVEIGAGGGQWAQILRTHQVDVKAFDDASALPLGANGDAAQGVQLGVDGALAAQQFPDRLLLLIAPPPGPQSAFWLFRYAEAGGAALAYIGEGRGGAHADTAFFAQLEHDWSLVSSADLKPFPGGAERLWLLRRRTGFNDDTIRGRVSEFFKALTGDNNIRNGSALPTATWNKVKAVIDAGDESSPNTAV